MATRIRRNTTSFAVNSVDRVIGRIYTLILILLAIEMSVNALAQIQYTIQPLFWFFYIAVMATFVGTLLNFWVGSGNHLWYRIHSLTFMAAVITWPLQVKDATALPDNFHPWMWWGLAIVLLGFVLSFHGWVSLAVLLTVPLFWFFARQEQAYGSASPFVAMQDSLYVGLLVASITSLIQFTRNSANKVDVASQLATEMATERARLDAIETERARIDALVHDSVLTTLLVAANAKTRLEQESAAKLAGEALVRLEEARDTSANQEETSASSLFEALASAAERADSAISISKSVTVNTSLPGQVASALTEATLQAVANSVTHAGTRATRDLLLKANGRGIKIVIKDDGRGFRPSRVPKNRLGIRLSIRSRLELIGGKARVDSSPGQGTAVILEWETK